jgi:hypothetical protein
MLDTWGMTLDNYAGHELEAMLKGLLPVGCSMHDVEDRDVGALLRDRARLAPTRPEREAHAVFFFFAASQVCHRGGKGDTVSFTYRAILSETESSGSKSISDCVTAPCAELSAPVNCVRWTIRSTVRCCRSSSRVSRGWGTTLWSSWPAWTRCVIWQVR